MNKKPEKLPAQDIILEFHFSDDYTKKNRAKINKIESENHTHFFKFAGYSSASFSFKVLLWIFLSEYTQPQPPPTSNHYLSIVMIKNGIFRLISILCLEKIKY